MNNTNIIDELKSFVSDIFKDTDKAHDLDHTQRVVDNALYLMKFYPNADSEVVIISSYLHDVDDEKLFFAKDKSHLKEWFGSHPSNKQKQIEDIINNVSFSKKAKPKTIEGKIVQDADRLDAIGAIGIARAFTYGGKHNRPIANNKGNSTIDHFYEKLFSIIDLLNLPESVQIAKERNLFMETFIEELKKEISLKK